MNWKRLRRIALYAIGAAVITAVVLLLVFQQVRLSKLARDFSERTASIVEELRKATEAGDETRQNVVLLADETNKILKALRLPTRTYSFENPAAGEEPAEEISAFLMGVDEVEASWNESQTQAAKDALMDFLEDALASQTYTITDYDTTSFDILVSGDKAFSVTAAADGSAVVTSITGRKNSFSAPGDGLVETVISMTIDAQAVIAKKNEMEKTLVGVIESSKDDEYFVSMSMVFNWGTQLIGDVTVKSAVVVRKGATLLEVYPDPEKDVFIVAGDEVLKSVELVAEIKNRLRDMDIRSHEEIKIDELKIEMTKLIEDNGFTGFIEARGLRLVDLAREDTDYYYYDIYDGENNRIGAFGIQKFLCELYLVDFEDVPITSIKTIQDDGVKKN